MSSCPDCIFEIHQLWQSSFSRVYSNCCCSCSFEAEIIKIGQSSHNMYSNKILNFQESTTILNACTKKSGNLLKAIVYMICKCIYLGEWWLGLWQINLLRVIECQILIYVYIYIYIYIYIYSHPQTDLFRSIRTHQCG